MAKSAKAADKKKKGASFFKLILILFLFMIFAGSAGLFLFQLEAKKPAALSLLAPESQLENHDGETIIMVRSGQGVAQITNNLERKGLVGKPRLFRLASRIYGFDTQLKAGEYAIPNAANSLEILDILSSGKSILHKLSIAEGKTSAEVIELVNRAEFLQGDELETLAEGTILPDTYLFQRGMTREAALTHMQMAQNELLADLWPKRQPDLPLANMEEAIILASIVEKETGITGERDHIAGVFINRLNKPMRLESDPTIIYGITKGIPLGRGLRRSEIDRKTPYNTYQIDGLPPTPICNPGREAITAVLNPKETRDLFFVADGTGGHVFARTYREHLNNVAKWRKIEREKRAEARRGRP